MKSPPNAAIEILEEGGEGDVTVVELYDPHYRADGGILHYTVGILKEPNHSYAIFNERHVESLPEHFGPVALFIDDCRFMWCWGRWVFTCIPCM